MLRRSFFRRVLLAVLAGWIGTAADAQPPMDPEMLKAALRTATPEENGFLEYVAARVNNGTLPRSLVESTLLWARRKSRLRFQYFKRGLILRAAHAGITL